MRPATVATRWERMLAISLVRVVRGCRGGMYESVQDAEQRKRSVCVCVVDEEGGRAVEGSGVFLL